MLCAFCKEEIAVGAVKCKHCKSTLPVIFQSELTICPFCKEEILPGAIKCKHCKTMLLEVQIPASAAPQSTAPQNQAQKASPQAAWLAPAASVVSSVLSSGLLGASDEDSDSEGEEDTGGLLSDLLDE